MSSVAEEEESLASQQEAEEAVASRIMQSLQSGAQDLTSADTGVCSHTATRCVSHASVVDLSAEDEEFFAMSIFELGLRYSSPKILVLPLNTMCAKCSAI